MIVEFTEIVLRLNGEP